MSLLSVTEPGEDYTEAPTEHGVSRHRSNVTLTLIAVGIVLVCAVLGYALVAARPEVYAAHAELAYDVSRANSSAAVQQQMQTAALVVGSRAVLNDVAEQNGLTARELDRSTAVDVVGQSGIISVTVERPSSEEAVAITQAVADAGVAALSTSDPDSRRALLEASLETLRAELNELTAVLGSDESSSASIAAELRYEQVVRQIVDLEGRLVDLRLDDAALGKPRVLSQAYELGSVSTSPLAGLAAGILLGLFVAGTMVAAVWQLRVRSPRP
jgi:hypothetical protein